MGNSLFSTSKELPHLTRYMIETRGLDDSGGDLNLTAQAARQIIEARNLGVITPKEAAAYFLGLNPEQPLIPQMDAVGETIEI